MPIDNDGSTILPTFTFVSERSLGFYRSGVSTLGLSYGALALPSGSATTPTLAFSSQTSLGWYRSAAGVMALSLGTVSALQASITSLTGTVLLVGVAGDGKVAYTNLDGLRIAGDDTGNTLYNASSNIGITRDAGGGIFIGATSGTADMGIMIDTTTGASKHTIGSAVLPSITFSSSSSLGLYSSGAQTIAQSLGTFNLATNAVRFSMRTLATSSVTPSAANTNVATNEVVFTIGGASGASFCISSGGTTYIFSSTASAKNT